MLGHHLFVIIIFY